MPRGCLLFLLGMVLVLFSACKQNRKEVFFGETGKIIYKKCSGCHYQGGPAPFSLYHYDEIRRRATSILAVLRTGYMPPWPADTGYSRFRDEKILSLDERQTIEKWIRDGCEKGDSLKDWKRPSFFAGSTMGRIPDKVVYMQKAFPIEADNTDRFVLMKLPFELEKDTVAS
ncbi:MAG: c-type cytochrome [Bacteroidota bacterium]